MAEMGKAMMGTGEAEGPKRAVEAAEAAISNPLLDDVSMKGAKGVLINITGGYDMTLYEADEAATRIREEVDPNANIIFGATFNAALEGKLRVSVVATGIDMAIGSEPQQPKPTSPQDTNRAFSSKSTFSLRPAAAAEKTLAVASAAQPSAAEENKSQPVASQPVQSATALRGPLAAIDNRISFSPKSLISIGAATQMQEQARAGQATRQETPLSSPRGNMPTGNASVKFPSISPRFEHEAPGSRQNASHPVANGSGFLHRVASLGRSLAARPEQDQEYVEKSRIEVREQRLAPPSQPAEDAYLEIPAFLRRQAN
jgi:cell division protein FtsZ